jgi:hypothetical protein
MNIQRMQRATLRCAGLTVGVGGAICAADYVTMGEGRRARGWSPISAAHYRWNRLAPPRREIDLSELSHCDGRRSGSTFFASGGVVIHGP